jgi:hypothetical protein
MPAAWSGDGGGGAMAAAITVEGLMPLSTSWRLGERRVAF